METKHKSLSECQVLVVDDEPGCRVLLCSLIEQYIPCDCVATGEEAIDYCLEHQPDLVVLDMEMPGMNGLEVCQALRDNPLTALIPVIFVTASMEDEIQNLCWEVRGDDFIRKPVNATTLLYRIKHHIRYKLQFELMEKLTFRDQLTGLYNRTYLSEEVPSILRQCIREQQPLAVIMLDVDDFKILNDSYGHLFGDVVLEKVALEIAQQLFRPTDIAIRYGGEEYLVILPDTDIKGGIYVADRILNSVREINIKNNVSYSDVLTLSAGIAASSQLMVDDLTPLLKVADENLYLAKNSGKARYIA
ncbi:GGDEF domain-containing response regulator [Vibrio mangrovi]|uniref:diguanylate cyclase n=1 Tax=Vibrio mangrovi TaxID=474394 RepID=A0A1Y6IZ28_9VIBR|nr:diguanylate cyclase [Vibrio mangrovi]MDW6005299.1 diguanylate cyclase [Vibrio mangrovi]SMS02925.1 Response regulator PleD [Vibrio mangrovi]